MPSTACAGGTPFRYPVIAPNNPAQPQKNCGQILSGAALTVGLDAAGVVAGAIPGTGAALVTAQVAIGVAGAANAAYNKDVGASFAAIGTTQLAPVAAISEQVGWTALQGFGGTVASAPSIHSFIVDGWETTNLAQLACSFSEERAGWD